MDGTSQQPVKGDTDTLEPVGLWDLVWYFLRLGSSGFGGPIALAGYMQRDLVPRRWISEDEYKEGLAFSQMMPGPLAAQLAMWIGFIRHGTVGASLVGIVFILPAFLIVLAISFLYVAYRGLAVVQALFYGIGPVVIAIVTLSALRLARTTVGSDWRLRMILGVVALITVAARAEIALLFVIAGIIGILLYESALARQTPLLFASFSVRSTPPSSSHPGATARRVCPYGSEDRSGLPIESRRT